MRDVEDFRESNDIFFGGGSLAIEECSYCYFAAPKLFGNCFERELFLFFGFEQSLRGGWKTGDKCALYIFQSVAAFVYMVHLVCI